MSFRLASLLIPDPSIPETAREALREAFDAPPDERDELLRSAAGILHREVEVACHDALELVGLPPETGCEP